MGSRKDVFISIIWLTEIVEGWRGDVNVELLPKIAGDINHLLTD